SPQSSPPTGEEVALPWESPLPLRERVRVRVEMQIMSVLVIKYAKRFIAFAMALVMLYTAVAVPVAQANVWEERRQAVEKLNGTRASNPTQLLYRLPAFFPDIGLCDRHGHGRI